MKTLTAILLFTTIGSGCFASAADGHPSAFVQSDILSFDEIVFVDGTRASMEEVEDVSFFDGRLESIVIDGETFFGEDIEEIVRGTHPDGGLIWSRLGGGGLSDTNPDEMAHSRLGGGGGSDA